MVGEDKDTYNTESIKSLRAAEEKEKIFFMIYFTLLLNSLRLSCLSLSHLVFPSCHDVSGLSFDMIRCFDNIDSSRVRDAIDPIYSLFLL